MTATKRRRRRPAPDPAQPGPPALEQLLRDLVTVASGHGPAPRMIEAADFESWDGTDAAYLSARLVADLPDIDLSVHDGCVMIRVSCRSTEACCKLHAS